MKKREASRRETSALDKSREAVIARINASIDEVVRELDGRDAKQAREEKRPKLVFPDPETVGFNLPDHLVGNSADYRTKKRSPGVDEHGFTSPEVSQHNTKINIYTYRYTNTYTFALLCSCFGHRLARTFAHLATFPFSLFPLP